MDHHEPRERRPLPARVIAVLERAGPLTLAEIANRLTMVDDKPLLLETLEDLGEDWVTETIVKGRGPARPQRVWSVVGDSRLRQLEPFPKVSYRAATVLEAFQAAARRRLRPKGRRGRGA